ncbi:hypothetical protein ATL39_2204 [Sinobaca qinghaiensis]|uniref:DUF456 family protein n=1 Tax=Sinobaca qinghaiensis TaxID=342944 RepID=A0A419V3H0_9BACL|nr:DUF456 domain-containing protein [Sinobaca qinghaiensis]RKD73002.1 hypothetical protein ATL39_2204 [Sinobaca qinghaiensis]
MDYIFYTLAFIAYALALAALIYPIVPGGIFYIAAIILIAAAQGFGTLSAWFWISQIIIAALLFIIDYAVQYYGIERTGGSKAATWGSVIGLIVGPFIIPIVGVLIGAIAGAIIGEMISGEKSWQKLGRVGAGSLAGFLVSVVLKGVLLAGNGIYLLYLIFS